MHHAMTVDVVIMRSARYLVIRYWLTSYAKNVCMLVCGQHWAVSQTSAGPVMANNGDAIWYASRVSSQCSRCNGNVTLIK